MTNYSKQKANIPTYNSIKTIKYLGINLINAVKDLYTENFKIVIKKNLKEFPSWLRG